MQNAWHADCFTQLPSNGGGSDMRPFAIQLYQQFRGGKTALELATETGIPLERIEQRIRAAEIYLQNKADVA